MTPEIQLTESLLINSCCWQECRYR